jgi:hypothetical protein
VLGILAFIGFLWFVWPPLVILGFAVLVFLVGWALDRPILTRDE